MDGPGEDAVEGKFKIYFFNQFTVDVFRLRLKEVRSAPASTAHVCRTSGDLGTRDESVPVGNMGRSDLGSTPAQP